MNLAVIDIESQGKELKDKINYVGFYTQKNGEDRYKIFEIPEQTESLRTFVSALIRKKFAFVGHNGKFDTSRMLKHLGINIHLWHDTYVLAYLCCTSDVLKYKPKGYLSLEKCAERELGIESWDIDLKIKITKDPIVIPYLKKDLKTTYQLTQYYLKKLPKDRYDIYRLIMQYSNAYKHIEQNGFPIDSARMASLRATTEVEIQKLHEQLVTFADINYNSSIQLCDLLYEQYNLPVLEKTEKGNPSVNASVLKRLYKSHPIIPLILEYRKKIRMVAFMTSWEEKMVLKDDGTTWLYPTFNVAGTLSGRLSASEPNLQQIPRDKTLKSLFRSPYPDYEFVQLDFSQIELRIAAIVAEVKAMKQAYAKGEDLHTKMACVITGKKAHEISKEERTWAKVANFGYLYGMHPPSFIDYAFDDFGITFSLQQAAEIRYNFFALYPEMTLYYEQVEQDLTHYHSTTSLSGRVYEIDPAIMTNFKKFNAVLRSAINFPVQNTASDFVQMGVVALVRDQKIKDDIILCGTVHDAVIALIKKEKLEETIAYIKQVLTNPPLVHKYFSIPYPFEIPMVVDEEIGPFGLGVSLKEYEEGNTV